MTNVHSVLALAMPLLLAVSAATALTAAVMIRLTFRPGRHYLSTPPRRHRRLASAGDRGW
jgi:hypothetical protein